jgi:hypothetical protein
MYGNVFERVSDVYKPSYYANSPKVDPTGPLQGESSCFEYTINVPQAGKYALAARVVTVNYVQTLNVSVNDDPAEIKLTLPFTSGKWQDSEPVVLDLKQGTNIVKLSRTNPPQYGIAIKSFTLKLVK